MSKIKLIQICIVLLSVIAVSCSNDTTTSPTDNTKKTVTSVGANIFVNDVNTYFISEKYTLDSLNVDIAKTMETDSLVNKGKITAQIKDDSGNLINQLVDNFVNYKLGITKDSLGNQIYYTKNNDVYASKNWFDDLLSMSGSQIQLPFEIEAGVMLKIISSTENQWTVYTKTFNNQTFSFGILNGTLTVTAKKQGAVDLTLASINFKNTMKNDYVLSFVGKLTPVNTTMNLDLNLNRTLTVWYADGYGKIKEYMGASNMVIPGITSGYLLPGFEKYLIRTNK